MSGTIEDAMARARRGDLAGARASAEAALVLRPRDPALLRLRAWLLQQLGLLGDAETAYRNLVAAEPADYESWTNLGSTLLLAGDAAAAAEALDRAAALREDLVPIQINLAMARAALGDGEGAAEAAAAAVRLAPGDAGLRLEAGRIFGRVGRHAEAVAQIEAAARIAPREPQIRLELGLARAAIGDLEGAEREYRAALALAPGWAPGWLALGTLRESAGRGRELPALVQEALAAGARRSEIEWLRALALRREGRLEEALAAAKAAPAGTDPAERWQLIGEVEDRLGRPREAFAAFAEMNRAAAAAAPGDVRAAAGAYRAALGRLHALVTPEWVGSWGNAQPAAARQAPVFLIGFPRSGTTLLDTMLMGHPALHVLEELPVLQRVNAEVGPLERLQTLDAQEIARLRRLYFETAEGLAPGGAGKRIVDKYPLAIGLVPLIHRIFPDARFIFAWRHPCDVVLSCFMTNFRLNDAVANFLDLEDAARLYDGMLTFWEKCRAIFPLQVHDFRYEAMVADREAELRPLVAFLGLPWDEALLDHQATAARRGYVSTPSYAQVTEEIYSRAAGRWERYRTEMAPVLPILAPWAERLGYRV